MATPVTAWNRQKYEDQYQYQYQHDSYDAAIADAYAYRRDFGKSNLRKWSSTEGMDTPWDSNYTVKKSGESNGKTNPECFRYHPYRDGQYDLEGHCLLVFG